jgi:membrane protein implicated in regulation of membrane protease activity
MDTPSKPGKGALSRQKPRPPGFVLAWISALIVFVLAAGIGVVVFSVWGHSPWPTPQAVPEGAAQFAWVFRALLIVFMAYVAARCSYRSTLRAEAKRREEEANRRV